MASTATKVNTLKEVASSGNLNQLAEVAKKAQLGQMLQPMKITKTGLTAAASFDITSLALGSNPAAGQIQALRVTAGAAAAGLRQMGDSGATPSATVATISDDGKTITFEANVTAFVMLYTPRSAVDSATQFES